MRGRSITVGIRNIEVQTISCDQPPATETAPAAEIAKVPSFTIFQQGTQHEPCPLMTKDRPDLRRTPDANAWNMAGAQNLSGVVDVTG